MREILFRGKAFDNMWVEGLLVWIDHNDETALIRKISKDGVGYFDFLVDFETAGQYTGLTDKNGKKIFEGDIVRYNDTIHKVIFCTINGSAFFGIAMPERGEIWNFDGITCANKMEVIGNTHDNPELLEEREGK